MRESCQHHQERPFKNKLFVQIKETWIIMYQERQTGDKYVD